MFLSSLVGMDQNLDFHRTICCEAPSLPLLPSHASRCHPEKLTVMAKVTLNAATYNVSKRPAEAGSASKLGSATSEVLSTLTEAAPQTDPLRRCGFVSWFRAPLIKTVKGRAESRGSMFIYS